MCRCSWVNVSWLASSGKTREPLPEDASWCLRDVKIELGIDIEIPSFVTDPLFGSHTALFVSPAAKQR